LHGDEPILVKVTADEILRRDRHSFQDACSDHWFVTIVEALHRYIVISADVTL
jgi:hypothetical protein